MPINLKTLLAICFFILPFSVNAANPLPQPSGPVVLSVTGDLDVTNRSGGADFDMAMLKALPQTDFDTTTPWTEGSHRYSGVSLKTLFERLGVDPESFRARALNDYSTVVEYAPVKQYPLILAITQDDKPMRIRDKGPLWLLYPMSDFPQLDVSVNHNAMVWQLRSIEIE